MKLTFDRDLIEAAYLAQGPRLDPRREELYEIEDPQRREEAFSAHLAAWFRGAGLEQRLRDAFYEWPLVVGACAEGVLRRVRNPVDEVAELFRNDEGMDRVGVGIRSARIGDGSFVGFLRHELQHIHDMLDPAFGYPAPGRPDPAPEGNLRRDRYGLLWDISIDARLSRRFPAAPEFPRALRRHRDAFDRTFSFLPDDERGALFLELSGGDAPRHGRLWEVACDPRRLSSTAGSRLSGAACPVCGFATFHWADERALAIAASGIRAEFPDWGQESGCCERCAEIYAAIFKASIPATVLLPSREQRDVWSRIASVR
ncbi:MAG TPA: hypothetical protein PLU30_05870 [Verrucomicrobiae bacterium]|nr:hypothetical protein [Verrucomicrobiae bacterium]